MRDGKEAEVRYFEPTTDKKENTATAFDDIVAELRAKWPDTQIFIAPPGFMEDFVYHMFSLARGEASSRNPMKRLMRQPDDTRF